MEKCHKNIKQFFSLLTLISLLIAGKALTQDVTIFEANFNTDEDGFTYLDDVFRDTDNPGYASGLYNATEGFTGGGLQVNLGGLDDTNIFEMSGGWHGTFASGANDNLVLSLRYNLTQSGAYESSEISQVLVSLDGRLFGARPNDFIDQLAGDGNDGPPITTGWQQFQVNLGRLSSGVHTLIMGAYNNRKTLSNEFTELLIDDVKVIAISGNVTPYADAGPDQYIADDDDDGHATVTLDGSASEDVDGTIVSYEWQEGGSSIATGEIPTVNLPVGEHTITLSVADDSSAIASDDVVTTINSTAGPRELVNLLSFEQFKGNIQTLASFGDRSQFGGGSQSFIDAQNWVVGQLETAGYTVERHNFLFQDFARDNIYVTKVGKKSPDKMYIISAHLDGRGGGGAADDDGSGSSLVLEAARAFAKPGVETDISVRFIWWSNEETGLNGSTAYASERAALQGMEMPPGSGVYPEPTWLGMIQHDMILFDHGLPPQATQNAETDIDVEYQAASARASESLVLANTLQLRTGTYFKDYPAEVGSNMSNTDSAPFRNLTRAVSVRENQRLAEIGNGSNPHWHQPTDLFSTYSDADFRLGFNALEMTLGTVAELVGAKVNVTSVEPSGSIAPNRFTLAQNYPNPFNPTTNIQYELKEATYVKLEIYNLLGQKVVTLVAQRQPSDNYQVVWDARDDRRNPVVSGVYVYQLRVGHNFTLKRKMVLLR